MRRTISEKWRKDKTLEHIIMIFSKKVTQPSVKH